MVKKDHALEKLKSHMRNLFSHIIMISLCLEIANLNQKNCYVEYYATKFICLRILMSTTQPLLVSRFIFGLKQSTQHIISLLHSLTFTESHQQAITLEAQSRNNFSPWKSSRSVHFTFCSHHFLNQIIHLHKN